MPLLFNIAASSPESWLRVCGEGVPSPHEFSVRLTAGVLIQGVVVVSGLPLGVVSTYGPMGRHGTAWLEVVGGSTYPAARDRIERAGLLFARHVIDRWNLRKLYVQHGAFEASPLGRHTGCVVSTEARLPSALRHDGHYWDIVIESVTTDRAPG